MATQPPKDDASKLPLPEQIAETLAFVQGDSKGTRSESIDATPHATVDDSARSSLRKRPSLIGQSFDDLEILEEIGRGGMGVVYKARQKSLDRLVAVKLLLAELAHDETRLARFHAEARASAALEHRNIIQVYQVGECAFGHYFAMEYIDGQSLESLIQKGKIKLPSAVALTMVLAEAMHYAHAQGIVHRDLKPANILVDRNLRPVIMDFGIAKRVDGPSGLTQFGVIMGTPAYMAPEQAGATPEKVGPHSDIYALGAILYTMLTGRPPFEGNDPLRIVLKVIGPDLPPPVRSLQPHVPEKLERICAKCMAKEPAERYADGRSLAQELRPVHRRLTHKQAESTVTRRQSGRTMRQARASVLLEAADTGKKIRISHAVAIVGRTSECDIVLRAADVSKQHCRIVVEEEQVMVEDLGSANGTFVNGEPIQRAHLKDGDRLGIANYEFVVRVANP